MARERTRASLAVPGRGGTGAGDGHWRHIAPKKHRHLSLKVTAQEHANTRKRTQPAWTGEHSASEAISAGVGVERSGG
jgi:hypothetical protein